MASGFPGSIDNFTDPLTTSALNSPSHAGQHQDLNDAVEKIETYMGLVKVIPTGATNGTVAANGTVTIGNAVTSVTVSGAFSSLYDNYRIIVNGGVAGTDINFGLRLGSTATGYYEVGLYTQITSTSPGAYTNSNATLFSSVGYGNANDLSATIELRDPYKTKTTLIDSLAMQARTNGYMNRLNGWLNDTTSYTAFTLIPNASTLTGGTIRIYGYRN